MCGIAGFYLKNISNAGKDIVKMTESLVHRGPDDWGYVAISKELQETPKRQKTTPTQKANLFLGHRRLAIINIKGSVQPLANEDNSVWVSFNGEIYNYCELRKLLISKGHTFREDGDTEVLVHLWEEFQEEMLELLQGMFSFVIYDKQKDILFIARDRFGQKPLFYFEHNQSIYFASELQALKQLKEFPIDKTDYTAISQFFRYSYIPSPRTAYMNVYSLPPGHSLIWKNRKSHIHRYWKPVVTAELDYVDMEELQSLIDKSVKIRLRTDVPLGTFLSGGIDSGLITSSAMKSLSTPVNTFTISTGDYWCDESKEASLTAKHLKTNHHVFKVKPNFIDISAKLAKHYGQPFADYSSVMTYYVSKETRQYATVALAGDGGDELFAGYTAYMNTKKYQLLGKVPQSIKACLAKCSKRFLGNKHPYLQDAILAINSLPLKGENISTLFHFDRRKTCFNDDFKTILKKNYDSEESRFTKYYNEAKSSNPVERWMEVDQQMYLPDDILTKVDIASMAVSLECRAPFLDHKLAEFANKISVKSKIKGGSSKHLLKQLARQQLPQSIVDLPKKGFAMPLGEWMQDELKDWMYETIFNKKDTWLPYLKEKSVENIWNEHQTKQADNSAKLWQIASLILAK